MSDFAFAVVCVVIVAAVFVGILVGGVALSNASCHARWPDRNPSYGMFQGCMIDTDEGRIPASNFRVL